MIITAITKLATASTLGSSGDSLLATRPSNTLNITTPSSNIGKTNIDNLGANRISPQGSVKYSGIFGGSFR